MWFWIRMLVLFALCSVGAQVLFGFNHLESLRTLYTASTPHVEALYRGIQTSRYIDAVLFGLGFLFRRSVKIVITKSVTFLGTIVLPAQLRRFISGFLAWPKQYLYALYERLHAWYVLTFGPRGAVWFTSMKYGFLLFVVVLCALETAVALVRGVILLPPWVLEYKVQIVTGFGSLVLGTFSQQFILFVWESVNPLVPKLLWRLSAFIKAKLFRHAVKSRIYLRKRFRQLFLRRRRQPKPRP